jgi:hypothetical protein
LSSQIPDIGRTHVGVLQVAIDGIMRKPSDDGRKNTSTCNSHEWRSGIGSNLDWSASWVDILPQTPIKYSSNQ